MSLPSLSVSLRGGRQADVAIWDTIIVGAGAAGLMAAITAAREGRRVLLLDGKEKIGAKILMSGGTRCNITNQKITEHDFETENKRVLRNILNAFPSERAVKFFSELGVRVVLEPGGKFFPSTHSGRTVLEALLRGAKDAGVILESGKKVTRVLFSGHPEECLPAGQAGNNEGSSDRSFAGVVLDRHSAQDDVFIISGENFSYFSKTVILTTGGLSYPATGSDGAGYEIAKSFGHRLIPTTPSLVPLETGDPDWKSLSGISLPVRLTLFLNQKKKAEYEGSFLFAHFGFSGPVTLNISRHWIRRGPKDDARLVANFLPEESEDEFRKFLIDETAANPKKFLKNILSAKLPERFVEVLLDKVGARHAVPLQLMNQLTREEREKIIAALFHFPLNVTGALGYQKAEVTAGGIDLDEVNPKTLESKLQPGLFFAGEILDVDGRIGGFNFQWSWASGFVAGSASCHCERTK